MKLLKNKYFLTFSLLVFFLLLLKIDYRFVEEIKCCQDDHDYYMHAETIAVDFDFNYDNQLEGFENKRFNDNGKIAPKGFLGTGLFSSPFLFLGDLLNNFQNSKVFNFKILFYSLSSIFYFFLSIFLMYKLLNSLNINANIFFLGLLFFGSGLPYFAFERYSMSHVYEVFSIVLVLYLSNKYYISTSNKGLFAFLIPIAIGFSLLVRWVNYYVIFLPLILKLMFYQNEKLTEEKKYSKHIITSSIFSVIIFSFFSNAIYGRITFNPQYVYGASGMMKGFLMPEVSMVDYFLLNLKNFFLIIYTKEFGILWFSSIIFVGLLLTIRLFFVNRSNYLLNTLLLFSFLQNFAIVLMWKSTASSYGFRYLFNLIPLSILVYFYFKSIKNTKLVYYYLVTFSFIGILSLFFFETTEMTQLSLVDEMNSFGRYLRFTEPNYLIGFFFSFFEINSYLKIFTTSLFGSIIFKLIFLIYDKNQFISILSNLGLPVNNEDFVVYLDKINEIEVYKFVLIIVIFYFISKKIVDTHSAHD